jgi:hypothetical protein
MQIKIPENAEECLALAAEAEKRAMTAADPEVTAGFFDIEERYMELAGSFTPEFVDRLLDGLRAKTTPQKKTRARR